MADIQSVISKCREQREALERQIHDLRVCRSQEKITEEQAESEDDKLYEVMPLPSIRWLFWN